jgi:hypothetical protein
MRFAKWKLVKNAEGYLIGPEEVIAQAGGKAYGIVSDAPVESGGTILGGVEGETAELDLTGFAYEEITDADALAFVQGINPEGTIEDGRVIFPETETA